MTVYQAQLRKLIDLLFQVNQQSDNINEMRETINEMRQTIKIAQTEAQEWKAQFQRADEERYALSAANADLVSRQLYVRTVKMSPSEPTE